MKPFRALTSAMLIAALASGNVTAAERTAVAEKPVPKIAPLVSMLVSSIFSAVLDHAKSKLESTMASTPTDSVPSQSSTLGGQIVAIVGNTIAQAITSGIGNAIAPAIAARPATPLAFENGQPNYQGAKIAVTAYDQNGNALGDRPVNADFHTGERIKLKVLPTFTGNIEIDNINPRGERNRIYPEPGYAVQVQAGREVTLPMRDDQFFEFADNTGLEQLVITIRDPRAQGAAQASTQVYRQDDPTGSYYVQQVSANAYPAIAQTIRLMHK